MVSDATTSPKVCQQLQTSCAAITDWRFRFGAASVLMEVAHGTQDAVVRSAVVRGSCSKGTIVGCLARSVWQVMMMTCLWGGGMGCAPQHACAALADCVRSAQEWPLCDHTGGPVVVVVVQCRCVLHLLLLHCQCPDPCCVLACLRHLRGQGGSPSWGCFTCCRLRSVEGPHAVPDVPGARCVRGGR